MEWSQLPDESRSNNRNNASHSFLNDLSVSQLSDDPDELILDEDKFGFPKK
jgi:hypothetical protein